MQTFSTLEPIQRHYRAYWRNSARRCLAILLRD